MNPSHSYTEGMDWPQRQGTITTDKAIQLLCCDEVIYWNEDGYENDGVDWLMVAIFFNTQEIHSFNQGMKTRLIL